MDGEAGIPDVLQSERMRPITYPRAIWDEDQNRLIPDAKIAEVPCTAFASKKGKAITARLIVRRVHDLNRKAAEGQDELLVIWRYHAVSTGSPFESIQAEARLRRTVRTRGGDGAGAGEAAGSRRGWPDAG